jgi:hypothetical protein
VNWTNELRAAVAANIFGKISEILEGDLGVADMRRLSQLGLLVLVGSEAYLNNSNAYEEFIPPAFVKGEKITDEEVEPLPVTTRLAYHV